MFIEPSQAYEILNKVLNTLSFDNRVPHFAKSGEGLENSVFN